MVGRTVTTKQTLGTGNGHHAVAMGDFNGGRSRPILEAIRTWLEAERGRVLPKSPIGEAIGYTWNQWTALTRCLEAGFLEIDNGASKRGLRPVAVGRNNWLFVGSDRGGRTAAILISLCASCKRVGVDPLAYLTDVLERISTHPMSRIDELLRDHWQALRQSAVTSGDLPAGSWQVSEIPEVLIADVVTESASA